MPDINPDQIQINPDSVITAATQKVIDARLARIETEIEKQHLIFVGSFVVLGLASLISYIASAKSKNYVLPKTK